MTRIYIPPMIFLRNMKFIDFLFSVGTVFGITFIFLGFFVSLDANDNHNLIEISNYCYILGILLLIIGCIAGFFIFRRSRK